tara:strand:+ start:175 stop:369 length:195 start_codon:yes stop_codon:yes gene_type:complete
MDFSDAELAAALHFIEGHEDCLENGEIHEWMRIREKITRVAGQVREVEEDNRRMRLNPLGHVDA